MAGPQRVWSINSAGLEFKVLIMRDIMDQGKFRQMMASSFKDTGRHMRRILQTELPKQYEAKSRWIGSAVKQYRMGAGGMSCTIPISGVRGILGSTFRVSGARGRPKAGVRQIIRARIVKSNVSQLPEVMKHQGGNPPFRAGGLVFTRRTKARKPIVRVAGLGVPQMPVSERARPAVEKEIIKYLGDRIQHNFERLI